MNLNLKIAIIRSGQKAYQLARSLDWHPTKLSHIVNGAQIPTEKDMRELAEILSADVEELFPTDPVAS